jgi:hypothetical protein
MKASPQIAAKVRASMKESNRLLDKLESRLFDQLSRVYRNIQRDLNLELSPGLAPVNWTDIQYIYREEVDDIIRAAVHTIYEVSARKTVEVDIELSFFMTQTDLVEIRRLTQKYQDSVQEGPLLVLLL